MSSRWDHRKILHYYAHTYIHCDPPLCLYDCQLAPVGAVVWNNTKKCLFPIWPNKQLYKCCSSRTELWWLKCSLCQVIQFLVPVGPFIPARAGGNSRQLTYLMLTIHPSRGAGAYHSCHPERRSVHPGQEAKLWNIHTHIHTYRSFSCSFCSSYH